MKNINLLVVTFFMSTYISFSQIPNNGFENWTSMGSYSNPDGWATMNEMTDMNGVYTATMGSPGNVGASYLKLTSKKIGQSIINGIAVSGEINPITMEPKTGFPFNGLPKSLTGNWQYMSSSSGSTSVLLSKWNVNTLRRDTIAYAFQTLKGMAMSWASFEINLDYRMSTIPDSCIITFKSSGTSPSNYDYLYVDNLSFNYSVANIDDIRSENKSVDIYPNPVKEELNISMHVINDIDIKIQIIGNDGKLIYSKELRKTNGNVNHMIDTSLFPKGIYFVDISSETISETRKIVIQ